MTHDGSMTKTGIFSLLRTGNTSFDCLETSSGCCLNLIDLIDSILNINRTC